MLGLYTKDPKPVDYDPDGDMELLGAGTLDISAGQFERAVIGFQDPSEEIQGGARTQGT
jgi:hypothetical protein